MKECLREERMGEIESRRERETGEEEERERRKKRESMIN
jgi:hypothetical protein